MLDESSIPPEQIEAHLNFILASESFAQSKRCCDFLRFVTERALVGDSESIKERTLGIEIFKRPDGYDPGQDSVDRPAGSDRRWRRSG